MIPADCSLLEAGISQGAHSLGVPWDDSPEQCSPARGLSMWLLFFHSLVAGLQERSQKLPNVLNLQLEKSWNIPPTTFHWPKSAWGQHNPGGVTSVSRDQRNQRNRGRCLGRLPTPARLSGHSEAQSVQQGWKGRERPDGCQQTVTHKPDPTHSLFCR